MKKLISLLTILGGILVSSSSRSQDLSNPLDTAVVTGQVLVGVYPLPNASVQILSTNQSKPLREAYTDSDGNFYLQDVPIGDWQLRVARHENSPKNYRIKVAPGLVKVNPIQFLPGTNSVPVRLGDSVTQSVLAPMATNIAINHLVRTPSGLFRANSNTVFNLNGAFETQTEIEPKHPETGVFNVDVFQARSVCVLINGTYLLGEDFRPRFIGKKVGEIRLNFSDDSVLAYPLTAWETIRETWQRADSFRAIPPATNQSCVLSEVLSEDQMRGDMPAKATLDQLTIEIPQTSWGKKLHSIEIRDLSQSTLNSLDPGIVVIGITIKSFNED